MLHPIRVESSGPRLAVVEALPASLSVQYPNEIGRWAFWLSLPVLCASVFIGLGIGTSLVWLYGGAVVLGPFGVVAAAIYLAMSTDTNGGKGRAVGRVLRAAPIAEVSVAARA
jgi:hypothetical protein